MYVRYDVHSLPLRRSSTFRHRLRLDLVYIMASRKFFVGGNFKMNPANRQEKNILIKSLNEATLDPSVGESDI